MSTIGYSAAILGAIGLAVVVVYLLFRAAATALYNARREFLRKRREENEVES